MVPAFKNILGDWHAIRDVSHLLNHVTPLVWHNALEPLDLWPLDHHQPILIKGQGHQQCTMIHVHTVLHNSRARRVTGKLRTFWLEQAARAISTLQSLQIWTFATTKKHRHVVAISVLRLDWTGRHGTGTTAHKPQLFISWGLTGFAYVQAVLSLGALALRLQGLKSK